MFVAKIESPNASAGPNIENTANFGSFFTWRGYAKSVVVYEKPEGGIREWSRGDSCSTKQYSVYNSE
ncbi:hypothetical protein ColTof4_08065 [Colletotrichum tofieldiae]|nr:hypothetical protein ColTof4_08065 [Colletotrichum tofieldiae]